MRHAQSEWNLHFGGTRIDPGIADPPLTRLGVAEAHAAVAAVARQGITRIVSSPYRRALETAVILAEALDLPITVDPDVRERRAFSCDRGSSPDDLARLWPGVDFGRVAPLWWGTTIESLPSLRVRADRFVAHARQLPEAGSTLVVSHWGFIRCVTGREVGNVETVRLELGRPGGDGEPGRGA